MKRLLIYCMSLVTLLCYADRKQEDFLQAQNLAHNEKYQEALVLYDTILKPGFLVWYNKGVCLYQLEKYSDALIAFKKAKLYADRSNYKMVEQAIDQIAQRGNYSLSYSWQDTVARTIYYIPIWMIQILFFVMLIIIVWYLLVIKITWKILILFILTSFQGVYVGLVWYVRNQSHGVIISSATGYSGPGKEYQPYTTFPVGSVVNVDKKEKNWYKIKSLKSSGWVEETALVVIEE